jgi:hypothetical protein
VAELKTRKSDESVPEFIARIEDARRREDSKTLLELMTRVTGATPTMWGTSIVGFGDRRYTYASGREGDWFRVGFSPRKQNLTVYVMGYIDEDDTTLAQLGKFTTGKSCLYIKRLDDVDLGILEMLVDRSYREGS